MMKYILCFLPILLGCNQSSEQLLIKHQWEIKSVSNPVFNNLPNNLDYGSPWNFGKNGKVKISDNYFLGGSLTEGLWTMKDDQLTINANNLNLDFRVAKLTESELMMVLAIDEENELEYYFEAVIP